MPTRSREPRPDLISAAKWQAGTLHKARALVRRTLRAGQQALLRAIWRARIRFGPSVALGRPEPLTIILLSYSRPRNIEPIVRAVLKCRFVAKVLVHNNNPDIDIRRWVRVSDERLRIENAAERGWAGVRWQLALAEGDPYYLAIDDDVFLSPRQIARLFVCLLDDPSVPHGVHGVLWQRDPASADGKNFVHLSRREASVDVLHQLYAVTDHHVQRYERLLAWLREHAPQAYEICDHFGDDIAISHCGKAEPRIHDVGPIAVCPTSHTEGVALNQLGDFHRDRISLLETVTGVAREAF